MSSINVLKIAVKEICDKYNIPTTIKLEVEYDKESSRMD